MIDVSTLRQVEALSDSGKWADALDLVRTLQRSVSDPSEKAVLLLGESSIHFNLGLVEEAWGRLNEAASLAQHDKSLRPFIMQAKASLYLAEENAEECLNTCELFLEEVPEVRNTDYQAIWQDIQQKRGFSLVKLKRYNEAVPILLHTLTFLLNDERSATVRYYLGLAYIATQQYEFGVQYLSEPSLKLLGKEWQMEIHFNLGLAHYYLGQLADAKSEFKASEAVGNELGLDLLPVYEWLANTCEGLEQAKEAEQYSRMSRPV